MPLNRTEIKSDLNLGVKDISNSDFGEYSEKTPRWNKLNRYDQYYDGEQYKDLLPWYQQRTDSNEYIPIRKRQPCVSYNIAKLFIERTASKLVGSRAFPTLQIPNDPDTEQLANLIVQQSRLKVRSLDMATHLLKSGSVFTRFSIVEGVFKIDVYNSKHCKPVFDQKTDQLIAIRIQYKFKETDAIDSNKKESWKWFRLDIDQQTEILYDNPLVNPNNKDEEPEFKVVQQVDHNFGFVPGEWILNGEMKGGIDGESQIADILNIQDAINYQLSQSDQAVMYTQDPQLVFRKMDSEEIDNLIASATKAWNLGREGEAEFIEINGTGIKTGSDHRTMLSQKAQDLAKVVILDPEKMVGSAQSGRAMEVLHSPMVDLVHELRPWIGDYGLVPLIQKMIVASILTVKSGEQLVIQFPEGYQPASLDIQLIWKPIFEPSLEDIQKAVSIATQAATANLISRETGTKFLKDYFGIVDPIEEQKKVIEQPLPPSPFGPFGGF